MDVIYSIHSLKFLIKSKSWNDYLAAKYMLSKYNIILCIHANYGHSLLLVRANAPCATANTLFPLTNWNGECYWILICRFIDSSIYWFFHSLFPQSIDFSIHSFPNWSIYPLIDSPIHWFLKLPISIHWLIDLLHFKTLRLQLFIDSLISCPLKWIQRIPLGCQHWLKQRFRRLLTLTNSVSRGPDCQTSPTKIERGL